MRQKMAIFKEENSVCRGTKFSDLSFSKWQYFLDELNLKFKNKTCPKILGGDASENGDFQRKNGVWCGAKFSNITKWQYFLDELNLKFKNKTRGDLTEE